jgi:SAM-dependent methyltransferase
MKSLYIHTQDIHNTNAANAFVPILLKEIGIPETVVDVGCGTGTWLKVLKEYGVATIRGIDGIHVNKKLLNENISDTEFVAHELSMPLPEFGFTFNLAICLEVAEHLPESASDTIVDTLCKLSDKILFSAALPGQGGQNHINEQPIEYWKQKFNNKGYHMNDIFREKIWNDKRIDYWYRQNIFLIQKIDEKPIIQPVINDYYHPELVAKLRNSYRKIQTGDISIATAVMLLGKALLSKLR